MQRIPASVIIFFLVCTLLFPITAASDEIIDQPLNIIIELNNVPIETASTEENAITMLNSGNVAQVQIIATGDESINLLEIKTNFIVADIDVLNKKDPLGVTLNPGDNITFIQTWEFDNRIINEDFALISGIYEVRYDVKYRVNTEQMTVTGAPFYIDFQVNPVKSVFGAVSTVAFVVTTLSAIRLVSSLKKTMPNEVNASIKDTRFKASAELKSFYAETGLSKLQGEFANRTIRVASNRWKGEKCPECGTRWEKEAEFCNICGTTPDKAEVLHQQSLQQKALSLGAELAGSVDGLTLSQIAVNLGDNVTPTADILELLTFSGLAIAQPRLSKKWNNKTRGLVFTGLQWSLYSIFWINACGISTISLLYLELAIASGILLPILISKIYSDRIRKKVAQYWKNGRE